MLLHTYQYSSGGLGDFIRSLYAYYVFCLINDIKYDIFIKNHPFEFCFKFQEIQGTQFELLEDFGSNTTEKTRIILEKIKDSEEKIYVIKSNIFDFISFQDLKKYRIDFLNFFYSRINKDLISKINELKISLNLKNKIAIHVRCGDNFLDSAKKYSKDLRMDPNIALKKIIELTQRYNPDNLILFTDNEWLKTQVSPYINYINLGPIHHTAFSNSIDGSKNTIIEFCLLGSCSNIITLSNSGFSFWSAFIHDITLFEYTDTIKEFSYLIY